MPSPRASWFSARPAAGEGVWLAALEQGFGKFRAKQKGSIDEEGTDLIAAGGQPGATLSLLTGHRYKRVFLAVTADHRKNEEAKILPILRENLTTAINDHRLMTASVTPTGSRNDHPPKLESGRERSTCWHAINSPGDHRSHAAQDSTGHQHQAFLRRS